MFTILLTLTTSNLELKGFSEKNRTENFNPQLVYRYF